MTKRFGWLAVLVGLLAGLAAPAAQAQTPDQVGEWGPLMSWPLVAVHANLLNTGQVLVWDGFEAGPNSERLFDPATGTLTPKPYARNLFCAGQSQLADGKLFIAGGHVSVNNGLRDTTIWDPVTGTATRKVDMAGGRWYPTVTTLSDGRALVYSGDNIAADDTPPGNPLSFQSQTVPEVYNPVTSSYTRLTGASVLSPLYPFQFVLPDGRVFNAGPNTTTSILNPQGSGSVTAGPTSTHEASSAVMYAPGKVDEVGDVVRPVVCKSYGHRANFGYRHERGLAGLARHGTDGLPAVLRVAHGAPRRQRDRYRRHDEVRWCGHVHGGPAGRDLGPANGDVDNDGSRGQGARLSLDGSAAARWPSASGGQRAAARLPGHEPNERPDLLAAVSLQGHAPDHHLDAFNRAVRELVHRGTAEPRTASARSHWSDSGPPRTRSTRTSASSRSASRRTVVRSRSTRQRTRGLAPPGYYMLFILNSAGVPSVSEMVRLPAASEDNQPPTAPSSLTATGSIGSATSELVVGNGRHRRPSVTTSIVRPLPASRRRLPTESRSRPA